MRYNNILLLLLCGMIAFLILYYVFHLFILLTMTNVQPFNIYIGKLVFRIIWRKKNKRVYILFQKVFLLKGRFIFYRLMYDNNLCMYVIKKMAKNRIYVYFYILWSGKIICVQNKFSIWSLLTRSLLNRRIVLLIYGEFCWWTSSKAGNRPARVHDSQQNFL